MFRRERAIYTPNPEYSTAQVGFLTDVVENPILTHQLRSLGNRRYTPGEVLLALTQDNTSAPIVAQLTGVASQDIQQAALQRLRHGRNQNPEIDTFGGIMTNRWT